MIHLVSSIEDLVDLMDREQADHVVLHEPLMFL
jgi:hypothetical protein